MGVTLVVCVAAAIIGGILGTKDKSKGNAIDNKQSASTLSAGSTPFLGPQGMGTALDKALAEEFKSQNPDASIPFSAETDTGASSTGEPYKGTV